MTFAAALCGLLPSRSRVLHFQCDRSHAVAMLKNVIGDCVFCAKRCGQNERNLVLPNHVTGALSHASLGSAVGYWLKTERALIKMRRLLGVTDIKFNVICPFKRQKIFVHRRGSFLFWSSYCRWHNDLLNLSRRARPTNIRSRTNHRKVLKRGATCSASVRQVA